MDKEMERQLEAELAKLDEPETPQPKSKGVGDTIAKVTKLFGLKPCKACQKRQERLNKRFPYKE